MDWIADHRGECEALQLRKEEKNSEPRHRKDHNSSMFSLLNQACSSRTASSAGKSSAASKAGSDASATLNVQSLNQDLAIGKMRQQVQRLKESASRHKKNDHATFKSIQARLQATQSKLSSMEGKSSNLDKEKMLERERKRYTTF